MESESAYTSTIRRYDANRWMPYVWPIQTVFVVLAGYRNFEIIFKPELMVYESTLSDKQFFDMTTALIKLHKRVIGGRSELRYGGGRKPVFLDCAIRSHHSLQELFKLLTVYPFKAREIALHPGKRVDIDTSPYRSNGSPHALVTLARVYGMDGDAP